VDGGDGTAHHDGGGGAGATGRIRINALGATPDVRGLISPYAETVATTFGPLHVYE